MKITTNVTVPTDGAVRLSWQASGTVRVYQLLIIRTGSVPAYTAIKLEGRVTEYQINNLSRHQRYRVAVIAKGRREVACSPWIAVTPRLGLPVGAPVVEELAPLLSAIEQITVMPQDKRLTVYWQKSAGFVDRLLLELREGERVRRKIELEPEVTSISLEKSRDVRLVNGKIYSVRLHALFAGAYGQCSTEVLCTTAPQGEERLANAALPQACLVYPSLSLAAEIQVFPEQEGLDEAPSNEIVCLHCQKVVQWVDYRLRCTGCHAEYIPNGRGDFLDLTRLRFGTCQCCLPQKILVQKRGATSLTCAHSGKEHIRLPGAQKHLLTEDLPYGLCQCCRPRQPLVKESDRISCSKSAERHRNEQGAYVLVPSDPVFDAASIDDLMDAGLAEICSTGVSRGRA